MPERLAKKVLLIGWDAADWQFINPLLDAGQMPTLERMINHGVIGNVATLTPVLSPMLWTSIATGKRAPKHGIYGFIEPRPDGQGVQPVQSTSRKCKAIWNILSQNGLKSNVLGWYASHPAEPINGCCVSNQYGHMRGTLEEPSAVPDDAFHPRRIRDELMDLAIHPREMTAAHILPFIPKAAEIPEDKMPFVHKLMSLLADCATMQAAATHLMLTEPWDFMGVYFEAIDLFGHEFMSFHPPKMDHVDAQLFEWFKDVVSGIYRFHDMMLDAMLKCAGEDTTVILLSDHGFHSGAQRPLSEPGIHNDAPTWHRSYGILAMHGPGILNDERVHGSTLLDITPTILTLFGLPVGRDMDGKALVTAFAKPPKVEFIDTWETVPGDAGMHPPEARADPFEAQEALRQLADLGYVNLPAGEAGAHVDIAVTESKFNLATSLLGSNQHEQAIPILRELYTTKPDHKQYAMCLAQALVGAGELDEAQRLLEETREPFGSADYWKLSYARVLMAQGKVSDALAMLHETAAHAAPSASLQTEIGGVYERSQDWRRAAAAFAKAIEIDADYSPAHCGLGVIAIRQGNYEDAIEHLLRALALTHFYPRAHFNLAVALARLGWWDRAIKAFEVCTQMYPRMIGAYRYLSVIHQRLGHPTEAMLYRNRLRELLEQAKESGVKLNADATQQPELPEHPMPEPATEPLT